MKKDDVEDDEIAEEVDQDRLEVSRKVEKEEGENEQNADYVFNPILFTRGVESDAYYLILSGKVEVTSGNEGFKI